MPETSLNHHNEESACSLCDDKLKEAYSYMREWFHRIKLVFPDVHIAWAYRDKEDQERCFAEHKSKAHYPCSPHNRIDLDGNPESYALDLFQLISGKAIFDPIFYAKINDYNRRESEPILWGHYFGSLGDNDHFQYNTVISVSHGTTFGRVA